MDVSPMFGCKIFWAVFLPPIAVILHRGCFNLTVLLNICLTFLGWIPGIIHAFRVILDVGVKKSEEQKAVEIPRDEERPAETKRKDPTMKEAAFMLLETGYAS